MASGRVELRIMGAATLATAALCLVITLVQVNKISNHRAELLDHSQPVAVSVWNQIGFPEPAQTAQQVMHQNDNFGYARARPTMLAGEWRSPSENKPHYANVWRDIGFQTPADSARQIMHQSDDFGYKSRPTMLAGEWRSPAENKPHYANVWHDLGFQTPSQSAQQIMHQSDDFGYKSRPTMLSEAKQVGRPVNMWNQLGFPTPAQTAQQAMQQSDNFGYAVGRPTMLARTPQEVWQGYGFPDPIGDQQKKNWPPKPLTGGDLLKTEWDHSHDATGYAGRPTMLAGAPWDESDLSPRLRRAEKEAFWREQRDRHNRGEAQ